MVSELPLSMRPVGRADRISMQPEHKPLWWVRLQLSPRSLSTTVVLTTTAFFPIGGGVALCALYPTQEWVLSFVTKTYLMGRGGAHGFPGD